VNRAYAFAALLLGGGPIGLTAQSAIRFTPMGQVIGVATRAAPLPLTATRTEVSITQPVVMAHIDGWDRVRLTATLNFESLSIPDGELTPGAWGEGFVDRRHPHTTVHELMLASTDLLGTRDGEGRLGLALGKGFVPFGTDDPMVRPFLRYPVNHHLAQILERAVVIAQYGLGPLVIEGGLFNGDEPERAGQWPLLRSEGAWRFGDSWALRAEARVAAGLDLQVSQAKVHSPEHRPGAGGDARKGSVSIRFAERDLEGRRYAMIEWARTSELDGAFVFQSALAEGMVHRGRLGLGYRFERTERPEEERLGNPFRSPRPHHENSILGITRWTTHTGRLEVDVTDPLGALRLAPFLEVTIGQIDKVGGGLFSIADLYADTRVRQLSVGVSVGWEMRDHRMGRYGILASH